MKVWLSFSFLFLMVVLGIPAHAEQNDPFKDITIIPRPQDFETAKQLAKQNRVERIDRINDVMACIQQAKSIDDIYNCQELEADVTARIRLSYCETGVSWLYLDSRRHKKKGKLEEATPKVSECEKAQQAIENIKARRAEQNAATPKAEAQPASSPPAAEAPPAQPAQ